MEMQAKYVQQIDPKKMARLPIIDRDNPCRKYSEKEEKYLREIRTYEFSNIEQQGYPHSFNYSDSKTTHHFEFMHGGRYKVPRFIANHIESAKIPNWGWKPDGNGAMVKNMDGYNRRFQMREVYGE